MRHQTCVSLLTKNDNHHFSAFLATTCRDYQYFWSWTVTDAIAPLHKHLDFKVYSYEKHTKKHIL